MSRKWLPGSPAAYQFGEHRPVVGDVLQHVGQQEQTGLGRQLAKIVGRSAGDELYLRESPLGQLHRFGRRVDADAPISAGQRGDIAAGAAADVDNGSLGRRRQKFCHEPQQNSPPPDKPPVSVFDVGVELELFGLQGLGAGGLGGLAAWRDSLSSLGLHYSRQAGKVLDGRAEFIMAIRLQNCPHGSRQSWG